MTTLTGPDRLTVRAAIDQARRAQLDAQGGYTAVERDARVQERELGASPIDRIERLEREREALTKKLRAAEKRDKRKAGQIVDLRADLRRVRNQLYNARHTRDLWYTRATGKPADQGKGAAKTRLRAVA